MLEEGLSKTDLKIILGRQKVIFSNIASFLFK